MLMSWRGLGVSLLSVVASISCRDSRAHVTDPYRSLAIICEPAGVNVSCKAFLGGLGAREVTSEAGWYLSGPPIGGFAQPGLFVPVGTGEVGLRASC
jgi:hypothetical protein